MRKILLFLLLGSYALSQTQNVELIAKSVNHQNNTVVAVGDVLVTSEKYLITADNATYNTLTKDLELFGNINAIRSPDEMSRSEYLRLNIERDMGSSEQFFFFNQASKLWMRCANASFDPEYYITDHAVTSSCDVENPDWKIGFSSGELNRNSSFLHVYNALFYVKDVPVFWLPYFAFPTDKTRRTGLLRPEIGFGKDEGIFYAQPIYFAPSPNWDLELKPQWRTDRGVGIYSTLRFADSPYSNGRITAGIFRENERYRTKEDLKNQRHYGFDLYYDRSRLISPYLWSGAEDGFSLDFKYLNDIDYLNLKTATSESYDKLVTSRLNYFLRDQNNYIGVYGKYFIDTTADSNAETLQELPTMQYHKFQDKLFVNNLQYSIDAQYHNYYRRKGLEAQQFEMRLPVTLYWSLFDEALRVSVSENIYAMRVNYDQLDSLPDDYGQYLRNYHILSAYTDLARAYESFFHKMNFGAEYIIPSFDRQKGYLDRDEFVPINTEEEQVAFKFKQYFYDEAGNKRITHSITQPYYFEVIEEKFAPLQNKIELTLSPKFSISNELQYSHSRGQLIKSLTYASYLNGDWRAHFSHTFNKDEDNNYFSFDIESKIFKNSSLFAEIQYDIDESFTKSWSVGFVRSKKCWDYRLMYKEDTTPKLTSSGRASSIDKRGVYLLFNLYPLGGVKYEYATENSRDL
jgi:LPS-assembly protein